MVTNREAEEIEHSRSYFPIAGSVAQGCAIEDVASGGRRESRATLGVSLIITGFLVTALTALVTAAAAFGSVPKLIPPPWTLGQLIFTSSHPTSSH